MGLQRQHGLKISHMASNGNFSSSFICEFLLPPFYKKNKSAQTVSDPQIINCYLDSECVSYFSVLIFGLLHTFELLIFAEATMNKRQVGMGIFYRSVTYPT